MVGTIAMAKDKGRSFENQYNPHEVWISNDSGFQMVIFQIPTVAWYLNG